MLKIIGDENVIGDDDKKPISFDIATSVFVRRRKKEPSLCLEPLLLF